MSPQNDTAPLAEGQSETSTVHSHFNGITVLLQQHKITLTQLDDICY